jgi:hypothetical protein
MYERMTSDKIYKLHDCRNGNVELNPPFRSKFKLSAHYWAWCGNICIYIYIHPLNDLPLLMLPWTIINVGLIAQYFSC